MPIRKATLAAEGTIRPSVAFCFAVASGPFWCPESCSLERVATQWDIWIGHPDVPAFSLNQLFVNGDQLSQEPDKYIIFAIIACGWRPAKPRTGQKILRSFCTVSTICLLEYFVKNLVVILFIDGILFLGLFELASDRD